MVPKPALASTSRSINYRCPRPSPRSTAKRTSLPATASLRTVVTPLSLKFPPAQVESTRRLVQGTTVGSRGHAPLVLLLVLRFLSPGTTRLGRRTSAIVRRRPRLPPAKPVRRAARASNRPAPRVARINGPRFRYATSFRSRDEDQVAHEHYIGCEDYSSRGQDERSSCRAIQSTESQRPSGQRR
jgi:hypothetical protein